MGKVGCKKAQRKLQKLFPFENMVEKYGDVSILAKLRKPTSSAKKSSIRAYTVPIKLRNFWKKIQMQIKFW